MVEESVGATCCEHEQRGGAPQRPALPQLSAGHEESTVESPGADADGDEEVDEVVKDAAGLEEEGAIASTRPA